MTFPVTNAYYRLKTDTRRKLGKLTLDVLDHEEARLVEFVACWATAVLDRELAGSRVWPINDLAFLRGKAEINETNLPLRFRRSLLPAQRRVLELGEGTGSNLEFGFTPTQAMALDELEAALEDNEHPCAGHDRRRQCRARVVQAHQEVLKLGILDALTPNERNGITSAVMGNTVIPA